MCSEKWYYMKRLSLDIWFGKMNLKITLSNKLLDPPLLATLQSHVGPVH